MPELPEVETMRRGIRKITGRRIHDVCFPQLESKSRRLKSITILPQPKRLRIRLKNRVITSIDRLGKRVALRLDSKDTLVFEPRMTGLLLVNDPPDDEYVRFGMEFVDGPIRFVWYWDRRGLGSVRLFSEKQLATVLGPNQLGPDALLISVDQLRQRFSPSRRAIKVALLDQKAVAGIGNLYASEILHLAGIHPEKQCNRIPHANWQVIHAAIREVLEKAIRYEGSTLSDGTYRNSLNKTGKYQNHHRVYNRAGQPCPRCRDALIRRIVQAQRSTFYCGKCQRKRLPAKSANTENA